MSLAQADRLEVRRIAAGRRLYRARVELGVARRNGLSGPPLVELREALKIAEREYRRVVTDMGAETERK